MSLKKHFFCLVIFIFTLDYLPGNILIAQEKQILFSNLDNTNGLSHNRVHCILKDSRGFMWFGTMQGLCRYDGYSFKIFKNNSSDSNSISGNTITGLIEDNANKIWVKANYVIDVFDPVSEIFNHHHKIFNQKGGIPEANNLYYKDHMGNFWFANSDSGLYKYIFSRDSLVKIKSNGKDTLSINNRRITDFSEDSGGHLWLIHESGILEKINSDNYKVTQRINLNTGSSFLFSFFIDAEDDFWIFAPNIAGVIYYDLQSKQIEHFNKSSKKTQLNSNIIGGINQDNDGLIWIGTDHGGINILNKKDFSVSDVLNNPFNNLSLCQNSILTIYKDRDGFMWIGTFKKGVSYYHKYLYKFQLYKLNLEDSSGPELNDIDNFAEDKDGNLWIGTDGGGIIYFNRQKNTLTNYKNIPEDPKSLSSNIIIGMCVDHDNRLWTGTYFGGLNYFDGIRFYHYKHNPNDETSISDDRIWEVFEDSEKKLWLGTLQGGIDVFDPVSKKVIRHFKQDTGDYDLKSNTIFSITEDFDKNMWFATTGGLSYYDRKKEKFKTFAHDENKPSTISSNLIFDVLQDSRGFIWAATNNGLNLLSSDKNSFKTFKEQDGLPSNAVLTILEDNSNNLWVSTNNGLSNLIIKYDSLKSEYVYNFINYNETDGLQGKEFNEKSAFKTSRGELLFGGGGGFNLFRPSDLEAENIDAKLVFTNFLLFNKIVNIGQKINGRVLLSKSISYTNEITLKYKENIFTLEFARLNYLHPEKIQYNYKLEGFNNHWLKTDASLRKITYTNLNPGKYIFRVQSTKNDGSMDENETSIKIIILPPWWMTLFFRIAVILLIITVVTGFFLYRMRTLENQKRQLEMLVKERTHEIEEKNTILLEKAEQVNETNQLLEERQQQVEEQSEELMAQKEELEKANENLTELNSTKDKFFSIIAHDLKNPFASIMGFSEILSSKYDLINDDKRKHFIAIIFDSVMKVYELLENLLQWARSQTGKIACDPVTFDIKTLIEKNIDLIKENIAKKKISIHYKDIQSYNVFADINMIDTVIRNILSNALKYSNIGGEIYVICNKNSNQVEIQIKDTGTGMTKEEIEKLFRVENTVSKPGTNGENGTGLGLLICREFIERNNGKISIESSPGIGSAFSFTLPIPN